MSVIGEQIKKIRTEKGITQEQLGELIGVTTQAVSRWERGGTPDAELLPRISDVLGVSTDSLFGREEQSCSLALARRLCCMSQEDAFRYALNICWAIEIGLMRDLSIVDDFMGKLIDDSVSADSKRNDYFAKIIHDSGLSLMRISPDFKHFFLMQENGSGIGSHLSDFESLRRVFAMFADEKLLRILFYIYSMPNMPIATSLISKKTGLSLGETDRYMKKICENNLAVQTIVATAEGEINTYSFRKESFAVPMLCFADEIAKKDLRPFLGCYDRKGKLI